MGTNANLFCQATGMGTLLYSWEENSGSSWSTINGAIMSSYTTTTSGEYRCIVRNDAGSVNRTIIVNIYGKYTVTYIIIITYLYRSSIHHFTPNGCQHTSREYYHSNM